MVDVPPTQNRSRLSVSYSSGPTCDSSAFTEVGEAHDDPLTYTLSNMGTG